MTASDHLAKLDQAIVKYEQGSFTNIQLLAACFSFLAASEDWQEVVDVMHNDLKMTKVEAVEWFELMGYYVFAQQVERDWASLISPT